ncbi:hypothetical protein [Altibacter lentus]|uniref:hypothetical protein n=1 Tax=Altibacter lentus TaxID=1223410 RepID=UPI000559407D|nr:hypothetical protein [Altibacter lentus]
MNRTLSTTIGFLFLCFLGMSQIGIGTETVDPSAILQVESVSEGMLLPSLTTTNRNQILLPAKGLIIYNSNTNTFEYNAGTTVGPQWVSIHDRGTRTSKLGQSAKYSNTNISTDINAATIIDLPIFGNEEWNDNSSLFSFSGNRLQVNETGRYKLNVNVSIQSTSNDGRKAPEIYIAVNNIQVASYASTAYMRLAGNHEAASLHLNESLSLNANDIITVKIVQSAANNSASMRSAGSSTFYIEKID